MHDGFSPKRGGFPTQQNGSMSVMSLHGAAGAGGTQAGSSPGDPYASVNRISHPAGVSGGQRRSGGGSSLGSSPGQPFAEAQHAQAI
jgi:hypothetical protein